MSLATHILVDALMNPAVYPHPCAHVTLEETHISWVFLTGLRAYKIKKPVDLGFVDFTSLETRRHCCFEELRLNRRLAPELYLDVVAITGTVDRPEINGQGPVIDYAVCMVQFDHLKLLSRLDRNILTLDHMNGLADQCAEFHVTAAQADICSQFGSPDRIRSALDDNFETLKKADAGLIRRISMIQEAAHRQFEKLVDTFHERKAMAMIRECHGDMHLGNMFLQNDRVTVFDGIEFSDDFRWIDVINDIAFLMMDLDDRGYHGFSNRFVNRWLERTGDYEGLAVLRFYCDYRAMVRAKIDVIRMHQPDVSFTDQRHLANDCCEYLTLAEAYLTELSPSLTITMGPSGSGKSTVSQSMIDRGDMIRIRSDVERKRLFGLSADDVSTDDLRVRLYSAETTEATYDRLAELATTVINAGYPVIVDATFLHRSQRDRFHRLTQRLDVPFRIVKCSASESELRDRVEARQKTASDASEANLRVLERQLLDSDALDPDEEIFAVDASEVMTERNS